MIDPETARQAVQVWSEQRTYEPYHATVEAKTKAAGDALAELVPQLLGQLAETCRERDGNFVTIDTLEADYAALRERVHTLEAALEPFAQTPPLTTRTNIEAARAALGDTPPPREPPSPSGLVCPEHKVALVDRPYGPEWSSAVCPICNCPSCHGQEGAMVRRGDDDWEWEPCKRCAVESPQPETPAAPLVDQEDQTERWTQARGNYCESCGGGRSFGGSLVHRLGCDIGDRELAEDLAAPLVEPPSPAQRLLNASEVQVGDTWVGAGIVIWTEDLSGDGEVAIRTVAMGQDGWTTRTVPAGVQLVIEHGRFLVEPPSPAATDG